MTSIAALKQVAQDQSENSAIFDSKYLSRSSSTFEQDTRTGLLELDLSNNSMSRELACQLGETLKDFRRGLHVRQMTVTLF